jgi:hypothetical protein
MFESNILHAPDAIPGTLNKRFNATCTRYKSP